MKIFSVYGVLLIATYGGSQGEYCDCVFYYLCTRDNTVITSGEGIIDARLGENKNCTCENCKTLPIREVCCQLTTNQTTIPLITSPTDSPSVRKPIKKSQCGFANPDTVSHKIEADVHETALGEFPWMVGILLEGGSYRCGGSLINSSVVLTAAHCVAKKQNYTVRAGEWDSSNTREVFKHQNRKVSLIRIHENYTSEIYYNNIALLFLESPFVLEEHVNVACLPPANTVVDDAGCYATGWGRDKFGVGGKYSAILKKVLLPMVNNSKCQENLRQTRLGEYFILHKSFVCAGGKKGQDTCIGDGGGPLFCPIKTEENRYQQVGITSWGIGCNEENVPGVYTNVPLFRKWIDKQMRENNFEENFYQY